MSTTKWIVLRGLGRGHGHWGTFIQKLASALPEDKIYWLDLPGNGFLNAQTSPLAIEDYVSSLEQQLKATDFFDSHGRTIGVGLSLGAMVMAEWAHQHPSRFNKIFLVNTSAANLSKPWKRISMRVFANTLKQLFTSELEQFELNSLKITTTLSEEIIKSKFNDDYKAVIEFTKKYPITMRNILRQLLAASRYVFPKQPAVPTTLISGAGDRFVNPTCSDDIKRWWQCDLVIHPTAGHDLAFEDSSWLIETLKAHSV